MSARWYVVHTQPNSESRANEHLRRQGYITFLPKLLKRRRHARKTETVSRPLFPRYIFVQLDTVHQGWHAIRSTFGRGHAHHTQALVHPGRHFAADCSDATEIDRHTRILSPLPGSRQAGSAGRIPPGRGGSRHRSAGP